MTHTKNKNYLYTIVSVALMAALVYVGNYLQIKIPNGVLVTRIHLGNSMCLLAGLLFGGKRGGLSSGIGAALYDVFDPIYIFSAPYTFFSKFAMGWVCGKLNKREGKEFSTALIAAIVGQLTYILLYIVKSFVTILIIGGTVETALIAASTNLVTSLINGTIAVLIAVPLYFVLKKALRTSGFRPLIDEKGESGKKTSLLTIAITAVIIAVIAFLAIRLSVTPKL